jgi:hypothetical protein
LGQKRQGIVGLGPSAAGATAGPTTSGSPSTKQSATGSQHSQQQQQPQHLGSASIGAGSVPPPPQADSPQSPDYKPQVNLPPGWMSAWSKSQKRWYFFDTKTNKSVWKWPPGS